MYTIVTLIHVHMEICIKMFMAVFYLKAIILKNINVPKKENKLFFVYSSARKLSQGKN